MFGDELPNAIGLGGKFGLGSAPAAGRRERSGFAVTLEKSANERGADGEPLGNLGGGLTGLSSLKNASAKVVRDGCHNAVLGMSSDTPGRSLPYATIM